MACSWLEQKLPETLFFHNPFLKCLRFFGQLPVSQFSAVKEKHEMASHLACLLSGAVNISTNHGTGWKVRFQCLVIRGFLERVWWQTMSLLHLQDQLQPPFPSPSIPSQLHLHLSPASSEAGRCFENRMLGLRIIKEKNGKRNSLDRKKANGLGMLPSAAAE